jgi:23S rRNA pseudouridine1911/1915/1917 synthase
VAESHQDFTLEAADTGTTLAAALRRRLPSVSWSDARALCTSGKVRLDGELAADPAARVQAGQRLELRPNAPRPNKAPAGFKIVHDDAHLVVIEKPSGISSVPYERKETGTAMDLIRAAWKRAGRRATVTPLYVVHRIDKDTSGLICFAKTRLAERALHTTFQRHEANRAYLALAEGDVSAQRIESRLVADRGDGIRGSTTHVGQGQHAVTFVEPLARYPRSGAPGAPGAKVKATLCRVRLETGRTHQIRIHLAERGHPLVGETVYVRDLLRAGRQPLPAARLMLHAGLLGLAHPVTGEPLEFRAPPPEDFMVELERMGGVRDDARV